MTAADVASVNEQPDIWAALEQMAPQSEDPSQSLQVS